MTAEGPSSITRCPRSVRSSPGHHAHTSDDADREKRRMCKGLRPSVALDRALSLQLYVPVEVVEPAFVEVVGRELAAVFLQFVHGRAARMAARVHLGFARGAASLAQVAAGAGGDDVLPRGPTAP